MNSKPLLAFLIVITALNLALTSWIAFDLRSLNTHTSPLPAELSESKRDAIFEQVKKYYNAQDYDDFYAIFAQEVQAQIPKIKFISTMQTMQSTFGNIEGGTYSSHEFAGNQHGKSVYNLFYTVGIPKSTISPRGSLKITVTVSEGKVEIYGVYLFAITQ